MGKDRVHFLKVIKKQAYSNKFLYLVRMIYRALGTLAAQLPIISE